MTGKTRLLSLGIIAAVLLVLYMALLFFGGGQSSPDTVSSALLNEKYAPQVSLVRVRLPAADTGFAPTTGDSLFVEVYKQGNVWLFSPEPGIVAPVAASRMKDLLDAVAKVRPLSVFADTPKNREALSLREDQAVQLDFASAAGQVFSSLYFGAEDFTRRNISLRAVDSRQNTPARLYQTANDFAPWLTTDSKLWGDLHLIPECAGLKTAEDIQTPRFRPLLSYRGTGLLLAAEAETLRQGESLHLLVEGGNGALLILRLFSISPDNSRYAAVPEIRPGPGASNADREAVASLSYALEISRWTFDAITGLQ
jgi:hypothetical protein